MDSKDHGERPAYIEIAKLKKELCLVRNTQTQELAVKKITHNSTLSVYAQLARISYDGLPRIYEIREGDGEHITVYYEYIEGKNLQERLDTERAFTLSEIKACGIQLCDLLTFLHEQEPPIIHRDIKPANLLLTDDGKLWLIDFDAGRQYRKGATDDTVHVGTPGFAAPEQYGFGQSDARTDLYAVGLVLECLAGGSTHYAALQDVIAKCKSMDPNKRYQSAKELKRALQKLSAPLSIWKIAVPCLIAALCFAFLLRGNQPAAGPVSPQGVKPPAQAIAPIELSAYQNAPSRLLQCEYVANTLQSIMPAEDHAYFQGVFSKPYHMGFTKDMKVCSIAAGSMQQYRDDVRNGLTDIPPEDSHGAIVIEDSGLLYTAFLQYDKDAQAHRLFYFTNDPTAYEEITSAGLNEWIDMFELTDFPVKFCNKA